MTGVMDEPVATKKTVHDESETYKRSPQQFNSAESRGYLLSFQDAKIRNLYSSATLDLRLVLADVKTLLAELPEQNK